MSSPSLTNLRKLLIVAIAIAVLLVVGIAVMTFQNTANTEKLKEQNDLLAMLDADMAAKAALSTGENLDGDYWFDVESFQLTPSTENKPQAYGEGTELRGGAISSFEKEYGTSYSYDESQSYQGKIIRVTISGDKVNLSWVEA